METGYAGFWIRALATLIDEVVIELGSWLLQLLVLGIWYWIRRLAGHVLVGGAFDGVLSPFAEQILGMGLSVLLSLPYYVIGHARYGATLGKWACGVRVVRAEDFTMIGYRQSLGRFAAYLLSYLPIGAGFLMAAFRHDKRALHDVVAGTAVIKWRGKLKIRTAQSATVDPQAGQQAASAELPASAVSPTASGRPDSQPGP